MRKVMHQRLAEADRHIAETRKCIAQEKALVEAITREKRDAARFQELLALSEEVLRLMLARRKFHLVGTQRLRTVRSDSKIQCPRDVQ
jgi:hypothetical protein